MDRLLAEERRTDFRTYLTDCLRAGQMSTRQLAQKAGVSHGDLCRWLYSGKAIGPLSAKRLADALKLEGAERERLFQAARATQRPNQRKVVFALGALLKRYFDEVFRPEGLWFQQVVSAPDTTPPFHVVLLLSNKKNFVIQLMQPTLPQSCLRKGEICVQWSVLDPQRTGKPPCPKEATNP